jgi:glycosyltransferase involved in cell wall biosynthesis
VDACIRSGYGYRGEIRRIPFWIDPAPPQGEAGSILPADFLFLARKDRYKGFELAFDAIAALTESEGVRATIRVAGPGSDDWLRKRAAAYGLGEQLHIDFFRTRQAVMDALASARCLLLPSAHEGYPLVLLEALSQGTPVIATDTGGVADMLGEETVGTLVIPKDEPDALVDAVRQMYLAVRRGVPSEYRDALKARFAAINSRETIARHLSRVLT